MVIEEVNSICKFEEVGFPKEIADGAGGPDGRGHGQGTGSGNNGDGRGLFVSIFIYLNDGIYSGGIADGG